MIKEIKVETGSKWRPSLFTLLWLLYLIAVSLMVSLLLLEVVVGEFLVAVVALRPRLSRPQGSFGITSKCHHTELRHLLGYRLAFDEALSGNAEFCAPASLKISCAGQSWDRLANCIIAIGNITTHGLDTLTMTGTSILDCAATDVSNDRLPLMLFAGTSSSRATSS